MYGFNVRHRIYVVPLVALLLVSALVVTRARTSTAMVNWDITTVYGPAAPTAVTADGFGNIYIADGATVLRKDAQSGLVTTIVPSGLQTVDDMEIDAAGHLYLFERPPVNLGVNPPPRRIKKVDRNTLAVTDLLGEVYSPAGFGQAEGNGPSAFGVAPNGDIYIGISNRILVYPAGSTAATNPTAIAGNGVPSPPNFNDLTSAGATPLNNRLGRIDDIAIHPLTGDLHFSDSRGAILRISGGVLQAYASGGGLITRTFPDPYGPPLVQSPAASFNLSGPTDLAFSGTGQLFVAEIGRNSVIRIAADGGSFQQMIGDAGGQGFSGDGGPAWEAELFIESEGGGFADLAVGGGNALLLDGGNARIRSTLGIANGNNGRGPGPGTSVAPPTVDFTPPVSPVALEPALFTDTSTTPASWLWEFGDGTTSSDKNPTHVFASQGTYSVKLTVTSAINGTQGSTTKSVIVAASPNPPSPGSYVPVTPFRVLETRASEGLKGVQTAGPVGGASEIVVDVTGPLGQTAAGVDAVVLNLAAIQPSGDTFVTVYPDGETRPTAANLNIAAGRILPNLVITKVGANGKVRIFNWNGNTQFAADVQGYFPLTSSYNAVTPVRLLETRPEFGLKGVTAPGGPVGPASKIVVDVDGAATLPASGVGAVVLNVTAVAPSSASFVTVYPNAAGAPPTAANLNMAAGETTGNLVVATPNAAGEVAFYNFSGNTHLVADVVGWFPTSSPTYTGFSPVRALETRASQGLVGVTVAGPIGPGGEVDLQIHGITTPIGTIPNTAGAVIINVAATDISGGSFITVYPSGSTKPLAANLNLELGDTVPNLVIAKIGANGKIKLFNNTNSTALIGDVVGYLPR